MSLLTPLYLLGLAAAAFPIAYHFLRRTPSGKTQFSSLMFLRPSPPRLTKRSRLQHLPLLLLRVLALCLLGVAFARPFFRTTAALETDPQAFQRVVILIDAGAGMHREDLWRQATDSASQILDGLGRADQAAVWTYSDQVEETIGFNEWASSGGNVAAQLAKQRLDRLSPDWRRSRIGAALASAAEEVDRVEAAAAESSVGQRRRVVLISDLAKGSAIQDLQGFEWPEHVVLDVLHVRPKHTTNAGLRLLDDASATPRSDDPQNAEPQIRVQIFNAEDSKRDRFAVEWAGSNETTEVYVPAGEIRTVALPLPAEETPRLVLHGDDHPFDNTLFVCRPEAAVEKIWRLGAETADDPLSPLFYLRRAFPKTPRLAVEIHSIAASEMLAAELSQFRLAVGEELSETDVPLLRSYLDDGGAAVLILSESMETPLQRLFENDALRIEPARPRGYAMLGWIDFRHSLFSPFADPRFNDFTKIHFWQYRRVNAEQFPDARVIARFDSQDPAILEAPLGSGKLLLLASGWGADDSQLALSTKFVPLMHRILEWAGVGKRSSQSLTGDVIAQVEPTGEAIGVRGPDGAGGTVQPGESYRAPRPGVYVLNRGGTETTIAVNLPPEVNDTASFDIELLESFGVKMEGGDGKSTTPSETDQRQMLATELETRQKLWRWLIAAALLTLAWESWLAHRWSPMPGSEGERNGPPH